jgi:hypothetical protein
MEISLIIRTSGTAPNQCERVQDFIQSAVDQGHGIKQCFFQGAGVPAALNEKTLPRWRELAPAPNCYFAVKRSRHQRCRCLTPSSSPA